MTSSVSFFTLPLVYFFSIYGLYVSLLASVVAALCFLRARHRLDPAGPFCLERYIVLVKKGFPIMGMSFGIQVLRTADRFVIATLLGASALGYYGVAAMILTFILNIPAATREVLEPRMMAEKDGASVQRTLERFFFKPLATTACAMPLLSGPVFFIMPWAISLLLPEYEGAVKPVAILIFSGYFLALIYISRGVVVAFNWQIQGFLLSIAALAVNLGLSVAFIKSGWGLEGAAAASVTGSFFYFMSLFGLLFFNLRKGAAGWSRALFCAFWPVAAMAVIGGTCILSFNGAGSIPGMFVYYALYLALVHIFQKRLPLLEDFNLKRLLD